MSTHQPSPLGPLAAFTGTWTGNGFNTIFRPNGAASRTKLPKPAPHFVNAGKLPHNDPTKPLDNDQDNLLQLNLTLETLAFSNSLDDIPNRALLDGQETARLKGVPYTQSIKDVITNSGIHFEPGIWLLVPETKVPKLGPTVVRMASIPHGTTILAQGTFETKKGPPTIPSVDITPFVIGDSTKRTRFRSQVAGDQNTFRLPQTLPPTITQRMLDDPNSLLRDAIAGQKIIETTSLRISTDKLKPELVGSGTRNIAFLESTEGAAKEKGPNANASKMEATFWIETVELELDNGKKTTFKQIQYSQIVLLDFDDQSWPHVSVATLTQG
jgi:hypothetical protein